MPWFRDVPSPVGPRLRTLVVLELVFALVAAVPLGVVGGMPPGLSPSGRSTVAGSVPPPGAPGEPTLRSASKHQAKAQGRRKDKHQPRHKSKNHGKRKDKNHNTHRGRVTPTPTGTTATLLAAGDIAGCSSSGDEATAALLDGLDGTVVTLGDNVYDSGTASEFTSCYGPNWGRHTSRTRPAPGNHDYRTAGAAGYFGYFGTAAGDPTTGYYSYELGSWHIVALNSNCVQVGGCNAGSPQESWLRADLAAHPTTCTLAYWHHPRFSFGNYGNDTATQALWQALYDHGAEIVLSGHDHNYQQYVPQTPSGTRDDARGIREFVVGTGGRGHYALRTPPSTVEAFNGDTYGILQLTLRPTGYDWQFVPVAGESFTATGSTACH